jgi:LmbE family N-acetylglucosaminyl deacetylase
MRVVEIGLSQPVSSPFLEVGATVIGLAGNAVERASVPPTSRFHHLTEMGAHDSLFALGVRQDNADLVISNGGLDRALAQDGIERLLDEVRSALAAGGTFGWTYHAGSVRPARIKSMLTKRGLRVLKDKALPQGARLVIAQRDGVKQPLPDGLSRLSRTSCVDRAAVLLAHREPLIEGPIGTTLVSSGDPTLRRQIAEMLDALIADPHVDPASIPLPTCTATEATLGDAGCDILALFAHPDDESGFAGGTLVAATRAGLSVDLYSATGGEGSRLCAAESILPVRAEELETVSRRIGAKRKELGPLTDFGKYSDDQRSVPITRGQTIQRWDPMKLLEEMVRVIRTHRPKTILSFEPKRDPDYAQHGHHLAIGTAVMIAYHLAADPESFPELGLPPWAAEVQWAAAPHSAKGERIASIRVDLEEKRALLAAYRSQAYSTEELLKSIDRRRPDAFFEKWHLLQCRIPRASCASPIAR